MLYVSSASLGVAHDGGMTNLRNHLRVNHSSLYEELLFSSKYSQGESSGSKQDTMDRFLHSSRSRKKLSSTSHHAKMLSDAVVEFIKEGYEAS